MCVLCKNASYDAFLALVKLVQTSAMNLRGFGDYACDQRLRRHAQKTDKCALEPRLVFSGAISFEFFFKKNFSTCNVR